ncbi:hypothetical protein EV178_001729 [Coemansia sp. RSA 1646]|nr:hypothetical protein EV178_001729 [Coemansia sp. RSA 1646]KAJ2092957.1 hypothetical protein IW138_000671 [Coemansia sp. RSA 986]
MSNPWSQVEKYLKAKTSSSRRDEDPVFFCTLDSFGASTKSSADDTLAALLSIAGRGDSTVLGSIRRQAMKQSANQKGSSSAMSLSDTPSSGSSTDDDKDLWAISILRSLSETEIPDFSDAPNVWQLPHSKLARLCQEHLNIDSHNGPALAAFIDAAVSSPNVSFENQTLLLRHAASSRLFAGAEEAIPSVVQTRIIALLQIHPLAIAKGLLLPLLEHPKRLLPPATAMAVKIIKADMPATAAEAVGNGIASIAKKSPSDVNDTTFQVMEAVVSAMSLPSMAEKPLLVSWCKSWIEMVQQVVPLNCNSKKLSALVLHFVNRFGAKLEVSDLDSLAASASLIRTPLKAAITSTIARKKKAKSQ